MKLTQELYMLLLSSSIAFLLLVSLLLLSLLTVSVMDFILDSELLAIAAYHSTTGC